LLGILIAALYAFHYKQLTENDNVTAGSTGNKGLEERDIRV